MLESTLWIAFGGALGSVARFWLAEAIAALFAPGLPWGTILANVTGSFAIGLVAALPMGSLSRQFVMIGVLGGYTTFSSFSLQTLQLAQAGDWGKAGANVMISMIVCLIAVWLGHQLGTVFRGEPA